MEEYLIFPAFHKRTWQFDFHSSLPGGVPPSIRSNCSLFCHIPHMLKQVVIYREDNYWVWKVVDRGDREMFANDVCSTRGDAVKSLEAALNSMWPCGDNRRN